jgi:integrase
VKVKGEIMGTVYKKTATKALPAGAKIIVRKGQRFAEWKPAKGKTRTAPVTVGHDGTDRIVITARTYTAKFRNGRGIVREVATGCRDESAARSVLGDLERRAELVKAKVLTVSEDAISDHQETPLAGHVADYFAHQTARGVTTKAIRNARARLQRVTKDCGFRRLADLSGTALEKWLASRRAEGMGAATFNEYRGAWVAFANWCIEESRLLSNPFAKLPKADVKADRRRQRRALTEAELVKLLDVARRRPLLDMATVRRGKRKGEAFANLRQETRCRLERLGRERELIYKTLVLTGLRRGELASLTVGQLDLDADPPFLVLDAADEKNRQGSTIPLRANLAADLRAWVADKAKAVQNAAGNAPTLSLDPKPGRIGRDSRGLGGQRCLPLPTVPALPADAPLFNVPAALVKILDRDLKAAGIPKVDERGRTVDVHALRHTFGTLLSKGGVTPRTAQAAMRHSTINLTMNTYTDPKLLDVAGAMEALPPCRSPIQAKTPTY